MRTLIRACALVFAAGAITGATEPEATIVGGSFTYAVKSGDTIAAIAARFGSSTGSIIERNQLARPNAIAPGQLLAIDNSHIAVADRSVTLTINVPQRMLFVYEDGDVSAYPITVGRRDWPTPLGRFTIVEKKTNPVWSVPKSIQQEMAAQGKPVITRMEPSPDNPLGLHWLRLSIPGLGIHGTNAPSSIYRYASHGCVRMHPDDVAALFDRVSIGATGVLTYEPVILAAIDGRIWLEVHPDPYGLRPDAERHVRVLADRLTLGDRVDWVRVAAATRARAGRPEDITAARDASR